MAIARQANYNLYKKDTSLEKTVENAVKFFAPDEKIPSLEWAEKYRFLTSGESAQVGKYSAELTPYAKEWYAAFDDIETEEIIIVAGSQIGKTQFLLNILGTIIDEYPSNVLWVWPNMEQAFKFSRHRLKLLFNTPKLKQKFREKGDKIFSGEQIVFRGGSVNLVGSNSPSNLASLPARFLICDEVDRLNNKTAEGNAIELAKARTRTFFNRKHILTSTPTTKGTSQIYDEYIKGTKEKYCFTCDCGKINDIDFDNIKYAYDEKNKIIQGEIVFCCPFCGLCFNEGEIKKKIQEGEFFWHGENGNKKIRSFWLNAFVSPFISWPEIIEKYENAKNDVQRKRVIYNTLLGKIWEGEDIDRQKQNEIMNERTPLGIVNGEKIECPAEIEKIVMGIDTQDTWLACQVVGWGKNAGLCVLERFNLVGIPSEESTQTALYEKLKRKYTAADGKKIGISAAFMDSGGHYTSTVYEMAYKHKNTLPKIITIKGQGGENKQRISTPSNVPISFKDKRQIQLYTLGVDSYKAQVFDFIEKNKILFPLDELAGIDENYFEELLSEKLEIRNGKTYWRQINRRNESLDTLIYSMAGLEMIGCDVINSKKIKYAAPVNDKLPAETDTEKAETPIKNKKENKTIIRTIRRGTFGGGGGFGSGWGFGGGWGM